MGSLERFGSGLAGLRVLQQAVEQRLHGDFLGAGVEVGEHPVTQDLTCNETDAIEIRAEFAGRGRPGQIFCIGLNYGEHVRETGREVTETPVIFLRLTDSQVAHGQDILRPAESHRLDYEAEIAVVIGKGGRRIREEDAWNHIAGYSCYNDGSVRDWQVATSQWTPGKNFYKTGGFGPWMVTSDEIAPGQVMRLQTVLNGQVLQDTTTDKMIHSIPRQIAYISTFIPLSPGDVIVTGTPGGVGNKRNPQIFMKPGDVCEIVVDAIGTLRNGVRDDA